MTNNQKKMTRRFTSKQLKELREVNPWLTDGLFSEIVKDLYEDYNFYIFDERQPDTVAFNLVRLDMVDIKVVNAIDLYFAASNYPLVKDTESKFRDFRRYYIFNADDYPAKDEYYYLNELARLFEEAFTNVYRVYVDEDTKKIAFAFWL